MHASTITIPRAIAVGAVLVAAGLVLVARTPDADLPAASAPADFAPTYETPAADAVAEPALASADALADAKIRELQTMSETFRNTTFLIAIRDAGFVCNELLRVYGGVDESAKWMATCSEMLSYTVSVASSGALQVEPMLQYFDALPGPTRIEGNGAPAPQLELRDQRLLPPQPQR